MDATFLTQSIALRAARRRLTMFAVLLCGACAAFAQSSTSSGMIGRVTDNGGRALAGASIVVTHEPTGTPYASITDEFGRYRITGMQVGGPYTVEVNRSGYRPQSSFNVELPLGQARTLNFSLAGEQDDVIDLEAFEVVAQTQDFVFSEDNMGTSTTLDFETLTNAPSITRSIADIARLDSRVNVFDRDTGQISAGGKNTRYNSLLIDGVPTNDSFGLSESGLPALKQPFSLESLSEVSIRLSPYSVENAGFTGAAISAVTRSGTNEFSGSVFGFYRNDTMVGDLKRVGSDLLIPFDDFREYTVGATLGGPIIRNNLFFFLLYEKVEESRVREPSYYVPDPQQIDRITGAVSSFVTPFDLGEIRAPTADRLQDDKLLVKLDWRINADHRMSARFNQTKGRDPKIRGSGNTSFDSSWWTVDYLLRDYTVELFSRWTADFSSELRLSLKKQGQDRSNRSTLPYVIVQGISSVYDGPVENAPVAADISFGASDISLLDVDTRILHWKGTLFRGRHEIRFGFQYEENANYYLVLSNPYGFYRYERLGDFEDALGAFTDGTPRDPGTQAGTILEAPAPGQNAAADFKLGIAAAFVEDVWTVNDRLNLNFGLRIDYPIVNNAPPEARASAEETPRSFAEVFGVSNQNTIDGNYVLQPRIGFNYALRDDRSVQLRGGGGLFFGTAPHAWLATTYVDNGATKRFYLTGARQAAPPFSLDPADTVAWLIEEYGETEAGGVYINYIADDFKMPSDWKSNLALDIRVPALSAILTLEGQWSWTAYDIHYVNRNMRVKDIPGFTGQLPDGRTLYYADAQNIADRWAVAGYRDVIELRNTTQGESRQLTMQLQRQMKNNWAWRIGYTRTRAKTVNDGISLQNVTAPNIAVYNWRANTAANPNDDIEGTSSFEVRQRMVASVTREFNWSERHKTRVTMVYDGRSGRPFSYLGGLNIDLNKDGIQNNDLLYIPTGLDDPIVAWGLRDQFRNTEGVAFMEFVEATPGLREFKGQIVPRNTGRAPSVHQFDVNLTHEIRTWGDQKLELILNIQNIGNLLNEKWGLEKRPRGAFGRAVNVLGQGSGHVSRPQFGKGDENGYLVYRFEANNEFIQDYNLWFHPAGLASRWAMQAGLRYSF